MNTLSFLLNAKASVEFFMGSPREGLPQGGILSAPPTKSVTMLRRAEDGRARRCERLLRLYLLCSAQFSEQHVLDRVMGDHMARRCLIYFQPEGATADFFQGRLDALFISAHRVLVTATG